ncbi:MAG: biopolymer transporter ExbD [Ignavibacteriae bacterium]|nr:biopolymer transporter ExbD [Ignavibacteriota bacterium]MCB9214498.1 biopolymer transporter ExbD [Ignavibacteria bacterium]
MKFSGSQDSGYLSAFNFSSLTDIVMLLLIFFLLTSSFVTTKGLDVVLPEASNTQQHQDLRVDVSVKGDGSIAFNGKEITKAELPSLISAAITADTTVATVVVLRADQSLSYSTVVEMLDVIKGAGATRFFLATEKKK